MTFAERLVSDFSRSTRVVNVLAALSGDVLLHRASDLGSAYDRGGDAETHPSPAPGAALRASQPLDKTDAAQAAEYDAKIEDARRDVPLA